MRLVFLFILRAHACIISILIIRQALSCECKRSLSVQANTVAKGEGGRRDRYLTATTRPKSRCPILVNPSWRSVVLTYGAQGVAANPGTVFDSLIPGRRPTVLFQWTKYIEVKLCHVTRKRYRRSVVELNIDELPER